MFILSFVENFCCDDVIWKFIYVFGWYCNCNFDFDLFMELLLICWKIVCGDGVFGVSYVLVWVLNCVWVMVFNGFLDGCDWVVCCCVGRFYYV